MSGHTPHEQTDVARQWMPYQFHGDTRWSVCTRKSSYCHTLSDRQDADVVAQLLNERERVADTIDALSAQVATLTEERDAMRKALEEIRSCKVYPLQADAMRDIARAALEGSRP